MTHAGPHRDDLEFVDAASSVDLREFGSGGQQRTVAIALRMIEADTVRAGRGREPHDPARRRVRRAGPRPRRPLARSPGGRGAGPGHPDGAQGLGPGAPGRTPRPAGASRPGGSPYEPEGARPGAAGRRSLAGYLERSGLARADGGGERGPGLAGARGAGHRGRDDAAPRLRRRRSSSPCAPVPGSWS